MNYIESPEIYKTYSSFEEHPEIWQIENKVPISKIKVDKKYFAHNNKINPKSVDNIVSEFYLDAWEPITVNQNYYLLDGQHRIASAKRMGLKYIDVLIQNTNHLPATIIIDDKCVDYNFDNKLMVGI